MQSLPQTIYAKRTNPSAKNRIGEFPQGLRAC
jgi:hypothetical protein